MASRWFRSPLLRSPAFGGIMLGSVFAHQTIFHPRIYNQVISRPVDNYQIGKSSQPLVAPERYRSFARGAVCGVFAGTLIYFFFKTCVALVIGVVGYDLYQGKLFKNPSFKEWWDKLDFDGSNDFKISFVSALFTLYMTT